MAQPLERRVKAIVEEVRTQGDAALIKFTEKFDKTTLDAKDIREPLKKLKKPMKQLARNKSLLLSS